MNIPGTNSLSELTGAVEFIKLVSSTDGLDQVMKKITDEKKSLDEDRAQIAAARQENERVAAQLAQEKLALETQNKESDVRRAVAEEQEKNSQARLTEAIDAEERLEDEREAWATQVKQTQDQIATAIANVQDREVAATDAQTKADALIAEYDDKVAKLRQTIQ